MRKLLLVPIVAAFCIWSTAQTPSAPQRTTSAGRITASAVWQAPADFLSKAHAACDKITGSPANFAQCFIGQMKTAGAPAPALAFTQAVYQFSGGDVGILTGIHAVGPVDVAFVSYPRANRIMDCCWSWIAQDHQRGGMSLLDQNGLKQSPQFQDLLAQFPQASLFPGDRDGTTWPNTQQGSNNGLQFIVGYPLLNGCHACTNAGFALFTWNFDATGKFLGTTFMGLTPAPLKN